MIEMVAGDGVAAGPDNAHYYTDYTGGHMLLRIEFYNAVASSDWCWFLHHAMDLLQSYNGFQYWPALPEQITIHHPINCEYFDLGLACATDTVSDIQLTAINTTLEGRQPCGVSASSISPTQVLTAAWFIFNPGAWTAWTNFSPAAGFPSKGTIKPQYDYFGADAVIRIETEFDRLTPGVTNADVTWSAAAKPFGCLTNSQGTLERPDTLGLVLPVFTDVRLFPVDVSTAPEGGAFNLAWRLHIENHLPGWTDEQNILHGGYMQNGPSVLDMSCFYCRQLARWDNWGTWTPPDFRGTGLVWLSDPNHAASCDVPGRSGGRRGGGTHRGH